MSSEAGPQRACWSNPGQTRTDDWRTLVDATADEEGYTVTRLTYANLYSEGLDPAVGESFDEELSAIRDSDVRACPHMIAGAAVPEGAGFERRSPSDHAHVVSRAGCADQDLVDRAVGQARAAQPAWRRLEPTARASIIHAAITGLTQRREQLAALMAVEVGKTRADAIAEVDECIATVELLVAQYQETEAFAHTLAAPAGAESARAVYRPYGVFGAIAPFNFPMAIPFAMIIGALLPGNTVVYKPSALAPACGQAVYDLFTEAGVPAGALNMLHGDGTTGALLARAGIDGLVFTGSAEVGLGLVRELTHPPYARPVIAELGGKNPAVITGATDDVEVAARAVARSAFGMSGQKCNACSRAIVVDSVYDEFISALVAETDRLEVGDPGSGTAFTGPVVSDQAVERFHNAVAHAQQDGRVVTGGGIDVSTGNYVELTIVDQLELGHALTREELFVPLLTVSRVPHFTAAMDEANAVRYGLAAGVFTADAREQAAFLDQIEAGIVFVNNPGGATTGVWPGSQTMCGWKSSGTTGKGGFGPYYVQQFVREQSRTIFA
jgi:1-pyrroline-5-carboxylate dehydrogenase